ncbi:tetratricopeptide repeat protein [uncultured Kordia sp.]|uniref:tetratricopeptide repeat protein n=1 Tax=uncultured Kordia sp. TaxID=507699 RepID=UPI0026275F45|nr:tetratricopeptide repeat protein [uncultured Kordia sp.]
MDHKKYTEGTELSGDELEAISEKLIQAKFDREKRKAWEHRLRDEYGVTRESTPKKKKFPFSNLAIAAILMCIAGIVTYSVVSYLTPSYDSVVNESIEQLITIDNHAVVTRGNKLVNEEVLAAINAYEDKKYDESIAIWKKLISSEKIRGTFHYNLALCYLQKTPPETSSAITNLEAARKTKTIQEEANWALALAYLQIDQKDKAKKVLQEIIQAKAYKYKRAEIILAKL